MNDACQSWMSVLPKKGSDEFLDTSLSSERRKAKLWFRISSGTDNIDASWNLFKCSFAVNGIVVRLGETKMLSNFGESFELKMS